MRTKNQGFFMRCFSATKQVVTNKATPPHPLGCCHELIDELKRLAGVIEIVIGLQQTEENRPILPSCVPSKPLHTGFAL